MLGLTKQNPNIWKMYCVLYCNSFNVEEIKFNYLRCNMVATVTSPNVSSVLRTSLDNWAKNSPTYAGLFKTLSKDVLQIANDAFSEMQKIAPGVYEFWWAKQHVRYINHCKQRDLILFHEIMYNFLTAFSRGQLNESAQGKKSKAKT